MSGFRGSRGGYSMRASPRGRDDFRGGRGGFRGASRGFSSRGRFSEYDDCRHDDYDRDYGYDSGYRGRRDDYEDDYRKDFRGRGRPPYPRGGRSSPRGFRNGDSRGFRGGGRGSYGNKQDVPIELQELMTRTLFLQNKKFYIDVKENKRGKFIRICEVAVTGQKMKVVVDLCDVPEFHEKLTQLCEVLASLGKEPLHRGFEREAKLSSESMYRDNKRYFLDLKENHRGRFLKISMTPANSERSQVVIPAEGMVDVRDVLTDILSEFPPDSNQRTASEDSVIDMGEGKSIAVERSTSSRGGYIKVNETCGTFSAALMISDESLEDFVKLVEQAMNSADEMLTEQALRDNNGGVEEEMN